MFMYYLSHLDDISKGKNYFGVPQVQEPRSKFVSVVQWRICEDSWRKVAIRINSLTKFFKVNGKSVEPIHSYDHRIVGLLCLCLDLDNLASKEKTQEAGNEISNEF